MSPEILENLPIATVSVDVDPLDIHLRGYGVDGLKPDTLAYDTAVPRLLGHFAGADIRATFFFVARDAKRTRATIRRVADAGHEIASHSMTHPEHLSEVRPKVLRRELRASRKRLEDVAGRSVAGFRAPNWDLTPAIAEALSEAGYRYDASGYPTPLLAAARLLVAAKSRRVPHRRSLFPANWQRRPHHWEIGGSSLRQFPVTVTPWLRWPVYHTAALLFGGARTARQLEQIAEAGDTLSYPLHAVDVLGLQEDGIDARLARHPGMRRPLAEKRGLLARILEMIGERFETRTFIERLDEATSAAA